MKNPESIGSNWTFHHVGVIVRDIDEACRYYESLGIFAFQPEFSGGSGGARLRFAEAGPHRIELISPSEGPSVFRDFLDDRGEGMHHIAFTVNSLNAETAKLTAQGIPVLSSFRRPDGGGIAFFDLRRHGGLVIELIQRLR